MAYNSNSQMPNMNFEGLKEDLFTLFKSPNPIAIYMKSTEIKDKFSLFLNELSLKISSGFDLQEDSQSFISGVYKLSNYQNIWMYNLENYIRESKNFDVLGYLYFVFELNPDKKNLALALMMMYQNKSQEEIETFLLASSSKLQYEYIAKIYQTYALYQFDAHMNLREDFVEHFIEKVYLWMDDKEGHLFLDNFVVRINKKTINFSSISKILLKIISNYPTNGKEKNMIKTISMPYFHSRKKLVDELIVKFQSIRADFYPSISKVLEDLPHTERQVFWQYIKKQIIDLYHPEVKLLFYEFSSNSFLDKDTYGKLKGTLKLPEVVSEEAKYLYQDYQELLDLKDLIIELQDNIFSFFLLPIIYYTISEKITFPKKDLYKMKYVLLFIFADSYSEYKKIYMFFNQLEIFLNYEEKSNVLGKVQVSFSIIILVSLSLLFSYYYLPIGVFIGLLMLSTIKFHEIVYPNSYYNLKWNFGLKFFSILFLCISSYFWFQNFEKIKNDGNEIAQKIEFLGTLQTSTTFETTYKYIKASLFDIK